MANEGYGLRSSAQAVRDSMAAVAGAGVGDAMTAGREEHDSAEVRWFSRLEQVRDVWPAIAVRSGNLFATWEWISTWWRHFGKQRRLFCAVARRRDGHPAAIIPLYESAVRPVTTLRFLGHGPGDWQGPIHAPEDASIAGAALKRALERLDGWDLLLGEHMRPETPWGEGMPASILRREGFPVLHLANESWDQLLSRQTRNLRQQVRRRERRLADGYSLTYRLSDAAHLDADLDTLFRLHSRRWGARASGAFTLPRQQFHREFARLALERGWLRLWILELERQAVAVWYGFRYGGAEWYYQAGWDPRLRELSVGFVLLCHTIRAALEDGARAYLMLRGNEAYKYRFADEDPGTETVVVPRTIRGRAAAAALQQFDRVPRTTRERLKALAG